MGLRWFFLAAVLAAQTPPGANDWQKTTDLPGIETAGLSAEQKATLLTIIREESCTCNCAMKIAECRVKDPGCGDSRALAAAAVHELAAGKNPEQIRAALRNSELARSRKASLFGDPVAISTNGAP